MSSETPTSSSSLTSSTLASQDEALLITSRSLVHIFTATGQGANAPLINPTRNVAPPPLTLQPPLFTVAARSARKRGTSAETAPTTSVRDATAGAQGIPCPIALRRRLPRWQNKGSGTSSATGTTTGESAKEPRGSP